MCPPSSGNCNILQHQATHCNTLQYPATHCNTLQHTETRCNTLQRMCVGMRVGRLESKHAASLQCTATHWLQHSATPNKTNCNTDYVWHPVRRSHTLVCKRACVYEFEDVSVFNKCVCGYVCMFLCVCVCVCVLPL